MRARDHRTRVGLALRYVVPILLGGITGVLLSRLLFAVVFERGGSFGFLAWRVRP